jgi:IclR family acetate operon transcriptional repressor
VDRALRIVRVIGEHGGDVTLDELASTMDIPKSSLHRLLAALKYRGFVTQDGPNGNYRLGTELMAIAFRYYESLDLRSLIHPVLVRIRAEFNETTHMAVLDGGEVVYLDKVETSRAVKMSSVIGGRNPAHSTGVGKALLAWTYPTDEALRAWAAPHEPLAAATRNTLTSPAKLAENLRIVRDQGYAVDLEESEIGVRCVAVPVFLGRSTPEAAISLTAPKDRMQPTQAPTIATTLQRLLTETLTPNHP